MYKTDRERGTYHRAPAPWIHTEWAQRCDQPRGRNRTGPAPHTSSAHALQASAFLTSCRWNLTGMYPVDYSRIWKNLCLNLGFPGGSGGKESVCNIGDPGSIAGLASFPGERNGNPLQYFCLANPMERSLAGYNPWGRRVRQGLTICTHSFAHI